MRIKIPQGDDRGETLIESLISIVLLGILGTALLSGMITLTKSSALYDRQASAFTNQRSWAEELSKASTFSCGSVPSPNPSFPSTDTGIVVSCVPGVVSKVTIKVTSTRGSKTFTTTPLDVMVTS
jgi:Tfp pilus assembly protein PilV